ncbi:hypothetical protein HP439_14875, partial [Sphingobacterium shayense]|uniref:hypothetical protein n=1 Tax=Sphingobacterium shayense TaxID=626343 RepID=UPI00155304A4
MQFFLRYVVVLQIFIFSFTHTSFAQQDTLISFDDVEFTDGAPENTESSEGDTLLAIPEDLEFSDGNAEAEKQDSLSSSPVANPVESQEKASL